MEDIRVAQPPATPSEPVPWWASRTCLFLALLATILPMLYPGIPPLVDMPGHIGRYRIELDLANSALLQRHYTYHWAPVGNLGVDLLVYPLGKLIGLEPAAKVIVMSIPLMTAAGFLWVAREAHGRVPPTVYLALPFAFGFPFMFGFVNFALAAALAFVALGLWLRLGRLEQIRLRAVLFVPIAFVIYFAHAYGWGMLGLMCWSAELARLHDRGQSWRRAAIGGAVYCSVMALPLLVMLSWRGLGTSSDGWWDWNSKWIGITSILRDRWGPFDVTALEVCLLVFLFAAASPKLRFVRTLAFPAMLLGATFVVMPRFIFESAYADVRLLPYVAAMGLLSIGAVEGKASPALQRGLALFALAFFALRIAGTTASMAMAAQDQQAKLRALDHIPRGSRVVSLYTLPTAEPWALHRNSHLGGLVIARREGFSNDQWLQEGGNLLALKNPPSAFSSNPSEVVRPNGTHDGYYLSVDEALAGVPRKEFDFVWLIETPEYDARLVGDLSPVWRDGNSILYRIRH